MDGNRLADLIERAGFKPRSYSGRFMYGKQCVGVVVSGLGEAMRLGAGIVGAGPTAEERQDMARLSVREDNMGRDMIVYYPDVAWPQDRAEDDEDDDI